MTSLLNKWVNSVIVQDTDLLPLNIKKELIIEALLDTKIGKNGKDICKLITQKIYPEGVNKKEKIFPLISEWIDNIYDSNFGEDLPTWIIVSQFKKEQKDELWEMIFEIDDQECLYICDWLVPIYGDIHIDFGDLLCDREGTIEIPDHILEELESNRIECQNCKVLKGYKSFNIINLDYCKECEKLKKYQEKKVSKKEMVSKKSSPVICRRHHTGHYWNSVTGMVFSVPDKVVIGKMVDDKVIPLNEADMEICKEYDFKISNNVPKEEEKEILSLDENEGCLGYNIICSDDCKITCKREWFKESDFLSALLDDKETNEIRLNFSSSVIKIIVKYLENPQNLDVKNNQLSELIGVANYLGINNLLHLLCERVASLIKNQPLNKIKEIIEGN